MIRIPINGFFPFSHNMQFVCLIWEYISLVIFSTDDNQFTKTLCRQFLEGIIDTNAVCMLRSYESS